MPTNETAEAIARSERGADPTWKEEVYDLIKRMSDTYKEFTSQDVLREASNLAADTHDYRAVGPLMSKAKREGYIAFSGSFTTAENRHDAPIRIWNGLGWLRQNNVHA
jgi:hypothetical protein